MKQWKWHQAGTILALAGVLILKAGSSGVYATVGISTRFVDVTIEYVQLGRTYNLRELKKVPYTVTNKGTTPMDVVVDILAPKNQELVESYEALPDPAWVKIVPNHFRVEPGQTGYAEMIIEVPNDPKFSGRHYQARIWAHTESADMIGAGIDSRLKFSTGPGPETLKRKKKEQAMMTLDFDVTPRILVVDGIQPGKKISLKKLAKKTLKVTNRADTDLNMKFISVPWDMKFPLNGDFQPAPDPSWLSFEAKPVKVKTNTVQDVEPYIEIPDKPEYYGKQFAFLVKSELILGVELEVFNTIYVTVKPKE